MFVIVRTDGQYVTPPGSEKSYTTDLTKAQTFRTIEDAERNRCVGNERAVSVSSLMCQPR